MWHKFGRSSIVTLASHFNLNWFWKRGANNSVMWNLWLFFINRSLRWVRSLPNSNVPGTGRTIPSVTAVDGRLFKELFFWTPSHHPIPAEIILNIILEAAAHLLPLALRLIYGSAKAFRKKSELLKREGQRELGDYIPVEPINHIPMVI